MVSVSREIKVNIESIEDHKLDYTEFALANLGPADVPLEGALTEVPYDDRAFYTDPELLNMHPTLNLASREISLKELSPKFGSEVKDTQLASFVDNPKVKDELALLLTQRGVLLFYDQGDFFKLWPAKIGEFNSYYGVPHVLPITKVVKDNPEFVTVSV
ncbi:hypothetical protein BABINDRAFT_14551 [Babjeviella inositovora NRRL Y-12698]|uniref:TauD/TfdA-like domain-containing protein n=1 Tax=Babjeviella inositovora NRRL Y-12698 TaxID=984486 RepID=A0A1E3QL75_9ASCO|nr:uncharacterized protein BABINDRAFT_14551 [Babjeviella inositovora NRRL Y-12698]ODQ78368.1 hypothetical protein BABINDRAFT_14551 [Babjeviella inositovora NRRL Y-12698]